MASIGTTPLIALLLAVAAIAALCGFFAATVAQGRKRRARRIFVVGVFCGLLAGELVRVRRRGLRALSAVALRNDLRTQLAVIGRRWSAFRLS